MLFYYLIIPLLWLNISSANNNNPVIKINNGKLLGVAHDNYYSFEGIPYAEPPIGENRFESPKPYIQKWNYTYDATQLHEHCIQHPDPISRTYEINGIEDCLYLNIYTPEINGDKLYPVIFYIHGGGFMYGNGDLLRENIIMKHENFIYVTFNYRLNIFGFLSTGDKSISGNMGLKDQLLALKWINNNIKKFNGNPNKILLVGFSAGSASVNILTLQSGIENLASAGIAISGAPLSDWSFNPDPKTTSIKLGELLNCPTDNTIALKYCLKKKSAIEIVSQVKEFRVFLGISAGNFAPVAEDESQLDAIMKKHPRELFRIGNFSKIPIILSHTTEDGVMLASPIINQIPDIIKSGNKSFLENQPWLWEEGYDPEYMEEIFDDLANGSLVKLTELFTNRLLKNDIIEVINLRRQFNDSSTYHYKYDNPPPFGLSNLITGRNDINFGTNHGDDVFLMFDFPPRHPYKFRPDEERISDNFIKMMEIFINTGEPSFGNIKLPVITANTFKYLHIKADDYQIKSLD